MRKYIGTYATIYVFLDIHMYNCQIYSDILLYMQRYVVTYATLYCNIDFWHRFANQTERCEKQRESETYIYVCKSLFVFFVTPIMKYGLGG